MKKTFLSNFWLKIIALVTMSFDHIGLFLSSPNFAYENQAMINTGIAFRYIGRLALPIFIFLCVEGALKTHNIKKYILKLSLIFIPICLTQSILELITQFTPYDVAVRSCSIFMTLILVVFMVWAINQKQVGLKFLALIPIFISILSFFVCGIEASSYINQHTPLFIWWFPYMLRPEYDILAIALGLGFYLAHKLTDLTYQSQGLNPELHKDNQNYQFMINCYSVGALFIASILYYLLSYIAPNYVYWDANCQLFAITSGLFLLFYNGRLGYRKTWWLYFNYLYYPVHLVFIYAIFTIISLI